MSDPFHVILDLEWTAWDGARWRYWSGPNEEPEIVQIGALKVANDPELTELDTFEVLVRPRIHATLSDYFIDLTGITQDQVDRHGTDLRDATEAFLAFLGDTTKVLGFGDETEHFLENFQIYGMPNLIPHLTGRSVTMDVVRGLLNQETAIDSSDIPSRLGIDPPGRAHQALSDCRCIALGLRELRKRGLF